MTGLAPPAAADVVAENVTRVRYRIEAAGGDPGVVTLVAVTKGFDARAVTGARLAGVGDVGENYAQEAVSKHAQVSGGEAGEKEAVAAVARRWHFLGRLQRNKVRMLSGFVDLWQSVDSIPLIDEIAKRAPAAAVLLQVDIAEQPGRGGCSWAELPALLDHARERQLDVRGLMAVGPLDATLGPEAGRPGFARLAVQARRFGLDEVSMGMSDDLEVAVQEGSTMVRVGSALFGDRSRRPSA